MSAIRLHTSELKAAADSLHAGDRVLLSGTVYTSRDAAHKRIFALLEEGAPLPYPIEGTVIYYAGPTPAQKGMAVGSCGPTTSSRMNPYAPRMLNLGLSAIIGKGEMSPEVMEALIRNRSTYFCAVGGAGALAACCIKDAQEIAFHDLGCESVKRFTVEELPLITAMDCHGQNIFTLGRAAYQQQDGMRR